jgi:hypothetical protein
LDIGVPGPSVLAVATVVVSDRNRSRAMSIGTVRAWSRNMVSRATSAAVRTDAKTVAEIASHRQRGRRCAIDTGAEPTDATL